MVSLSFVRLPLICLVVVGLLGRMAQSGSINDIEHIVVFMQENRAFDHYYGTMKGVRGFNDRTAPNLPTSGLNPFYQPTSASGSPTGGNGIPTCSMCVKLDYVWCYEDDVCYNHGDPDDTKPFSCTGNSKCAASDCDCKSCDDTACKQKVTNAVSCHGWTCEVDGQYCPPNRPGATLPNGDCCRNGTWVGGTCDGPPPTPGPPTVPPAAYMLPYHINMSRTSAECMGAPAMNYPTDIAMWNEGRMDRWNTARAPGYGMGFFQREDLPYYYALSDGFTVGDAYHQSTFTETSPNRMHLFSGSNNNHYDPTGRGSNPKKDWMLMNDGEAHDPGYDWPTIAETLQGSNVSWKVYMEEDNFDDNGFAWFDTFQKAKEGSVLYDQGMTRVPTNQLVPSFEADIKAGKLPQVSWLVAPSNQSEHASNHPAAGEDLTARFLKVLQENPDVYAKTAFIIDYDEGGQFFDHIWPPVPPITADDGISTVDVTGETVTSETEGVPAGTPIGMGFRVPLFVVSPWSRTNGGAVYSELCDHTSVIQFIEKRYSVKSPNISPWRRTVAGDLTAAFDFVSAPDFSWPELPDTSGYVAAANDQCDNLPSPTIPVIQSMPSQEQGTKAARPLPYSFQVNDTQLTSAGGGGITLTIKNLGTVGAAFSVHNYGANSTGKPKRYTIGAGKMVSDTWSADYNISVHGPNGFVRMFHGDSAAAEPLQVRFLESVDIDTPGAEAAVLQLRGMGEEEGSCKASVHVRDNAYNHGGPWQFEDFGGGGGNNDASVMVVHRVPTALSGNWYDLTVTTTLDCHEDRRPVVYTRRYMGKIETKHATITDPAMATGRSDADDTHPPLPDGLRMLNENGLKSVDQDVCRMAFSKDACYLP
eukprot:m.236138 g.236138  ORF g.236138 m.236138 type:complete len:869 (-) comp26171_c0_seq1:163-2769(-)